MIERVCTKRFCAFLLGCAAILTSLPAYAESCAEREQMLEQLKNTYNETLAGGGLHDSTAVVEVWASQTTGSFTVISTDATGRSCIIATGTNWHGAARVTKTSMLSS